MNEFISFNPLFSICIIVARDFQNLINPPYMRFVIDMSLRYTRYEKARMVGARALQISMGSPSTLPSKDIPKTKYMTDPINIALREFEKGLIPLEVKKGRMINEERKPKTIEE